MLPLNTFVRRVDQAIDWGSTAGSTESTATWSYSMVMCELVGPDVEQDLISVGAREDHTTDEARCPSGRWFVNAGQRTTTESVCGVE
jgi:hypothetical protein